MNDKTINEFGFRRILEGVINLVLDLLNFLYPTQSHSLIANYSKGLINFFLHLFLFTDLDTLKIRWIDYKPQFLASLPKRFHIKIERKGTYGVYCNLRMNTIFIKKVAVWLHHHQGIRKELFSYTFPDNSTKTFHDVRFFGLVSIPKGSILYARIKFAIPDSWTGNTNESEFHKFFSTLFDRKVNYNNFGVFSVQ